MFTNFSMSTSYHFAHCQNQKTVFCLYIIFTQPLYVFKVTNTFCIPQQCSTVVRIRYVMKLFKNTVLKDILSKWSGVLRVFLSGTHQLDYTLKIIVIRLYTFTASVNIILRIIEVYQKILRSITKRYITRSFWVTLAAWIMP